jgi:hypothetical protein
MKIFHCPRCQARVPFEALTCPHCSTALVYLPLEARFAPSEARRSCANRDAASCNWVLDEHAGASERPGGIAPVSGSQTYCLSCRLTHWIPPLDDVVNRKSWIQLEAAKRRLIYGLLQLDLPVEGKEIDPERGVAFEFLVGDTRPDGTPLLTGHKDGVITIRATEANDAERGRLRMIFDEPNRTLLGHLRHECGHYYWVRLLSEGPQMDQFRWLFGDESADYGQSVQNHYANGAPSDWAERHVSAYATAHPWEDWAETWAHLLERIDALETAREYRLLPGHDRSAASALETLGPDPRRWSFEAMNAAWKALALCINDLNQSLGILEQYPVELAPEALAKLRFVHGVVLLRSQEDEHPRPATTPAGVPTVRQPVDVGPTA